MKTILVATDYSPAAEVALQYAVQLAKRTNAHIALLNVYKFTIHALNACISPSSMDGLIEENEQRLRLYAKALSAKYSVDITPYTSTASIGEAIDGYVKRLSAGIVVMGRSRNSENWNAQANTTTEVVRAATYPVLVVPQDAAIKLPAKLLFACDYQSLPEPDVMTELSQLTGAMNAELRVLHVSKQPALASVASDHECMVKDALETSIHALRHSYVDVYSDSFVSGLSDELDEYKADMLILSPHKYGFWKSMFHKSMTKEMALKSKLPLLSLPS